MIIFPRTLPGTHHSSDVVYWRGGQGGGQVCVQNINRNLTAKGRYIATTE